MNIPMSWLRDIIEIPDETLVFVDKVTDAGVKVEGIATTGEEITNVVVGQIKSLERHPEADRLWVTQTDIGGQVLQIITGADNLKPGDYIPVALHGATLVNGLKIKKSKMRGLESNGMLCSIGELGCTLEDFPDAEEDGIFVFDKPHPLGADAKAIMGLSEEVLDFEILSNRPDTNAVMGIAKEVAAVYNKKFTLPEIKVQAQGAGNAEALVSVEIKDTEKCPRYIARVVTDVKIAPSPRWMARRLEAAGLRPVNNIVDITNYVMLEYGQPLHAFDISAVAQKDGKHAIVVRTAKAGEKMMTLDGTQRTLSDTTLLIADPEKPLAIAGIMGGENTKVTDESTTILFESANFNAANIRGSAKSLGMRTDASGRYEKGLDPNQATASVNRAMELVELLNCGRVVPGTVDNYPVKREATTVTFSPEKINSRLHLQLTDDEIISFLNRVDIQVTREASLYKALIPTCRRDITGAVDLTEEVARLYGYNNITSTYTQRVSATPPYQPGMSPRRRFDLKLKQAVAGLGYYEAVTYTFESPKVADKLLLPADDPARNQLTLRYPLGEDMSVMRSLPLDGLLTGLSVNFNKRNESALLFEMAWTYTPKALSLTELPEEKPYLMLAAYGKDVDFFALKGDVEDILITFAGGRLTFEPLTLPYMHPGRTASISVKQHKRDAVSLGYLGELHPQAASNYGIDTRVYIAVLELDALFEAGKQKQATFTPPSRFPAMVRDLAFTVPVDITAAQAEAAIRERGGALLTEVTLFDVYQGKQIEAGFKSMAYSLKFSAPDRTLTDEATQKIITTIRANLSQKLNAQVREV